MWHLTMNNSSLDGRNGDLVVFDREMLKRFCSTLIRVRQLQEFLHDFFFSPWNS
jgi:hypothetical protein